VNASIEAFGWETTWRLLGAAVLVGYVPIAWGFISNRPEAVGLLPDGALPICL
jgi:hypothetical protein